MGLLIIPPQAYRIVCVYNVMCTGSEGAPLNAVNNINLGKTRAHVHTLSQFK